MTKFPIERGANKNNSILTQQFKHESDRHLANTELEFILEHVEIEAEHQKQQDKLV